MVEHRASVTVPATVHQVFAMFSHFNDFPKFMSSVKEVTYIDDRRSHWVAEIAGEHRWDAVNADWIADRQIGWRSIAGFQNEGKVTFAEDGASTTRLDVTIRYEPPAGVLGKAGEALGAGKEFERRLQRDLENFAEMVREAPPGALDPNASTYIFHAESAAARGKTTPAQDATMLEDVSEDIAG